MLNITILMPQLKIARFYNNGNKPLVKLDYGCIQFTTLYNDLLLHTQLLNIRHYEDSRSTPFY